MLTIRELAEQVNMNPTEMREWFPWCFDPCTADNECVPAETAWEVRTACGEALPTYLGD